MPYNFCNHNFHIPKNSGDIQDGQSYWPTLYIIRCNVDILEIIGDKYTES